MAVTLLVPTVSAYTGAIQTSTFDGEVVNANNFEHCDEVYLNGGPQNQNSSGLPLGEYYFQVTDPSGATLLSTTPADERRVQVVANSNGEGVIFGRAPDLDPAGYDDSSMIHHLEGLVNPDNGSKPVQLWHFKKTPNNGGVYKVWLIPVDAATVVTGTGDPQVDGIALQFASKDAKTDNFRCVHPEDTGENQVVIFGRKYYDLNANGVYDGGEEWNTADGRPPVKINLIWPEDSDSVFTDDNGLWFFAFELAEGATLDFSACEELPLGYSQTGPVDGDEVINGVLDAEHAIATASGGCWEGTITSSLGLINLNFGNVDTATIGGMKFYDANADGVWDGGELPIGGFKIKLSITYADDSTAKEYVYTNPNGSDDGILDGSWEYELPIGASVKVCEIMPWGSWVQTFPDGTGVDDSSCADCANAGPWGYELLVEGNRDDLNFGNVCLDAGGGRTLGFWSNKNGGKIFDAIGGLALVNGLPLKKANGDPAVPFANHKAFSSWILSASATNMANMLSAQLAAMALNVASTVDGTQLIHTGGCGDVPEFASVNAVIAAAIATLNADGNTPSGDPLRSYQECLKNALDDANNNLNFVQPSACPVAYPPEA